MNIDGSNRQLLVQNHAGWITAVDYHYRYDAYSAMILYYICKESLSDHLGVDFITLCTYLQPLMFPWRC